MELIKLVQVLTLLSLALVGSTHAVISPQTYWKSVLPNIPMPKAIKDLLYARAWDDGSDQQVSLETTSMHIKLKDQPEQSYSYVFPKYELKGIPQPSYLYWDLGSKNQIKDHPIMKLLFLENDLQQGKEMKLHFMKNEEKTAFLPKNISDSIPFSSKDLPKIYDKFSVKPGSLEAKTINEALTLCELKVMAGEETTCVTSLESMIDFSTTKLGKKVKPYSTVVGAKGSTPSQNYKIGLVKKLTTKNNVVACHTQTYPYAVFFCHLCNAIDSYVVSLEGVDGTMVKSLAICHTDTSKWNPGHLEFELLKVTPGTAPVCHFLPEDTVLWIPYY